MEKILISACLVGDNCTWRGDNNYLPFIEELKKKYELVPFCPEVAGGLSIPREPCEIRGADIVTKDGTSKAKEYNLGAQKALQACKLFNITIAILKESSPSCGVRNIYDGHFNQTKIVGKGITTQMLESHGVRCYSSEADLRFLIAEEKKKEKEYLSFEERGALRRKKGKSSSSPRKPRSEKKEQAGVSKEKKFFPKNGEKKPFRKNEGKKPFGKKGGKKNFAKKPYRGKRIQKTNKKSA